MANFLEGIFANFIASFLPGGNNALGALLTLWLFLIFFVLRWCWRRVRQNKIEIRRVIAPLALILFCLLGGGVGIVWLMQVVPSAGGPGSTVLRQGPPSPAPISVRIDCEWGPLPQTMPESGKMFFLPIDLPLDQRNIIESPQPRPFIFNFGPPGNPTGWKNADNNPRIGYACKITNYSDTPLFNVYVTFHARFVEVVGNQAKPENTVASKAIVMEVPNIELNGTFAFYVKNDGKYFAEIKTGDSATALTPDGTRKDVLVIQPTYGVDMSVFPGQ